MTAEEATKLVNEWLWNNPKRRTAHQEWPQDRIADVADMLVSETTKAYRNGMGDALTIASAVGPCSGTKDWNDSRRATIRHITRAILKARDKIV